ncbi:MAG: CrcB family protein [Actinomycetia bacterium]|nr:CrcB family protein [Actinomycetes bacterium]
MTDSATHRRPSFGGRGLTRLTGPVAVLAGGFVGSAARYLVLFAVPGVSGVFPSEVLTINLLGSLALGFFLARRERSIGSLSSLRFWAIGVLGSFTTFSAFSLEVVGLIDGGDIAVAALYVGVSMIGGLFAAVLGLRVGSIGR